MAFFSDNNDDGVLGRAYMGVVCSGSDQFKMSISDWSDTEARTGTVLAHELGKYFDFRILFRKHEVDNILSGEKIATWATLLTLLISAL